MGLTDPQPRTAARYRLPALALVLAAAGLHVAYLVCHCPLDLVPDEAHYWDWSRHPDWSYYSKGPLVAWLIRGGCALCGAWSRQLTGSELLGVRLPAVLCGSLLIVSLYVLTVQVYGRERLALAVVACGLTLPVLAAGSSLMTIDAPYTCLWGWALVAGHHAVFRRAAWAWVAVGVLVGLGILAKYTMVLWLPSLGLFLLSRRELRGQLARPGFWGATALAAVCSLPILIWNAGHGWVSLRHVGGLAGFEGPGGIRLLGPLAFVAGQAGLLLGFWFVAWLAAMLRHRPGRNVQAGPAYLWWMSAPTFAVFLLFGFKTGGGELNWPVTAYLSGAVLAAAWVADQLRAPAAWYRRLAAAGLTTACALGLTLTVLMHYSTLAHPLLARLSGPASARHPLPLRRFDPTCRLKGWHTLAAVVDDLRARLRAEGCEPVLAGTGWSLPGELAFYSAGHPTVYSLGPALGERRSQYDFWRPNPVADPSAFAGRTMILIGDAGPVLRRAFQRVEPAVVVTHREGGRPVARWTVTVCRGFRGFPAVTTHPGRTY
jgi:hypothetical protein